MKKRQTLGAIAVMILATLMGGCSSKSEPVESVEETDEVAEKMFEWPGGDEIPVLDCDDGTVLWDNSNGFAVTVNNIQQDDFEAYAIECEDDGYMRYYDLDGKYYLVNRESGYDLTLIHNGGDMLYICVDKLPELEIEEVEDVRPEVVAYMTELLNCFEDYKEDTLLLSKRNADIIVYYANLADDLGLDLTDAEKEYCDETSERATRIGEEIGEILSNLNSAVDERMTESEVEEQLESKVLEDQDQESAPSSADDIRPEFKQSMDSYEEFFDEYCSFMTKYSNSDNALSMLSDYAEFMKKYSETMEALDALGDSDMNDAESAYYIEVMGRINQKLLESIQ